MIIFSLFVHRIHLVHPVYIRYLCFLSLSLSLYDLLVFLWVVRLFVKRRRRRRWTNSMLHFVENIGWLSDTNRHIRCAEKKMLLILSFQMKCNICTFNSDSKSLLCHQTTITFWCECVRVLCSVQCQYSTLNALYSTQFLFTRFNLMLCFFLLLLRCTLEHLWIKVSYGIELLHILYLNRMSTCFVAHQWFCSWRQHLSCGLWR